MRLLFSLSSFALTMLLGLVAFAYTALNHPGTMREMISIAQRIRDQFAILGLSDTYMVWVDILLQSTQIVIVGFTIFIRLIIGILGSMFSGTDSNAPIETHSASRPSNNSPFSRWG